MTEWLIKALVSLAFNLVILFITGFVLMIALNGFFPVLSYFDWCLWALAGIAVVNSAMASWEFRGSLDNIGKR